METIFTRTRLITAQLLLAAALAPGAFADPDQGARPASPSAPPNGGVQRPGRLVSLAPSMTELLFALGAGPRVVGVSDHCDYPPEALALPRVGSFLLPVVESVLALRPDLVVTPPSPGNRNAVEAMMRAGVAVELVREGTLADLRWTIRGLGRRLGLEDQAAGLLERLEAEFARVPSGLGAPRPRVALVLTRRPLVLAGPASYLGELIELAGGENIANGAGGAWPRVGWEFLVASAPEVIIDLSMDGVGSAAALAAWKRHSGLPAVAEARVYAPETGLFARPGPRLGQAVIRLSKMIGR